MRRRCFISKIKVNRSMNGVKPPTTSPRPPAPPTQHTKKEFIGIGKIGFIK